MSPNQYFDEIFCVNLVRSTDRWKVVSEKFRNNNIHVTRFEGCDKLDPQIQADFHRMINSKTSKIKHLGRYAIWRTFTKLFDYILELDVDKVLIFEDDVLFHKDFHNLFDATTKKIPDNWNAWYLGATQVKWGNIEIEHNLYKPNGNTFGAFGLALRKSFIQSWIHRYRLGSKNNDHFLAADLDHSNSYVSIPSLIGHAYGKSLNADYDINKDIAEKYPWFKYDQNDYL